MLSLHRLELNASVRGGVSPVPHEVSDVLGARNETAPTTETPAMSLHLTPAQAAEYGFIASYVENITLVGVRADGRLLVRRSYSR
jgi:hypothetical protein